jgi:cytoskeletal protein RodZ
MSSAQFDPCRQWLGIDAVDLTNPRRVLGLLPSESDPLVVLRAADARLTVLKGIAPGPFDMARNALIKRVEEAREAVLAQVAATPKQQAPVGTSFTMPPPPGGSLPRAPAPPPIQSAGRSPNIPTVPAVPMPHGATEASPWSERADADHSGFVSVEKRPVYRKQSSGAGTLLLLLVGLGAAAGGLLWMKMRADEQRKVASREVAAAERDDQQNSADEDESERQRAGTKRTAAMRRPERDPNDTTSDDAVSTSAPPRREPMPVRRRPEPEPETTPEPEPEPEPTPEPEPAPVTETTPEPEPAPEPTDGPPVAEPAAPDKTDSPAPVSSEPSAPEETAAEINRLLNEVLVALQEQQFDAAQLAVKAADKKAAGPAQKRVASWDSLITYARGFADYRSKALAAMRPGQEYEIDGKKIAVIEIDAEKFIYRRAGKNKTVSADKIPGGILMAIITEWFDSNPANNLYLGAYHATKTEPDLEKARASWQLANARGADASALLPLLDDPVLVKAAADGEDQ